MGNSISNNSNNIRVKNNYTNKNYGKTIGNDGGSSQASLAAHDRIVATEEYDLSSPAVITKKEGILEKSEATKQIENYISTLENMVKQLEQEKEELLEKNRRFADSANRGAYPGLFIEEKNQGSRKKYLSPSEAIKSDECFKKYLKENGYPTDKNRMTPEKYQLLKNEYANYINTTYTNKYNEYFKEKIGMTYAEYRERITQINSDLETIKASKYELVQQAKEQPYIELMDTDDFQNYINNNKNNPDSELSKLYEIKNGTVETNDDSYWRFKYFTEQDMLIFSYLWDTQSPKVAREYVEAIEDKLNKAEGLAKANEFLDKLRDENGNIDANVWNGILSGGKGFGDGVLTFFDGLGNLFNSEGMMSVTQYEQMYILNELTNSSGNYINKLATQINETKGEEAAQEFISKIYTNNEIDLEYAKSVLSEQEYNNLTIKMETDKKSLLDNVYELGSSAGNMVPSMIVSLAVSAVATPAAGSVAGSTLMGLSAGGNSKNQALIQGNSLSSSIMYGVFSGVSETTLGLLLGNIPGLNVSSSFSVKGIIKEGFEELVQEYVDAGLRATILDEKIDATQLSKDALKSFLYGAIMSGVMNGGQLAFTAITAKGSIKITNIQEAITFAKENGIDISEIEGNMMETKQNSTPNISSTIETSTSSSISSTGVDIESQIAKANMYTEKGNFASIDVPDISMMTDEVLSNIKNIDSVRFRLQDGSVIDIASLLNKRNSAKMDGVLSKVSSETSSTISSDIESQIASTTIQTEKGNSSSISYSKGFSLAQYVKQYLSSNMRKFLYKDTSNFVGLNEQIMQNGLYHFTTNVDNIIASGYIKTSDFIASYASPLSPTLKSFFFNGIPEVGAVATNLDSVPVKATAIKIDATPELVQSSKLKLRYMDDMAITYDGKFNLDGYNVQKCFFGLDIEDGKLVYKPISEAEYQNYENTSAGKMLSDYVSNKKNLIAIKSDFFTKIFKKNGIYDSNILNNIELQIEKEKTYTKNDTSVGEAEQQFKTKIMQNSDFNKRNLIQGIIGNLPSGADQLTIARIIYLKLNQAVTYSDTFFASTDEAFKNNVYHQKYDINDLLNMNNNEIICSGWSQLYKELLICAGFDESKIKIESGKGDVSHKYISVDFGNGQLLLADGTSNISGITDLAASKIGDGTAGFAFVDKLEYEKLKFSGLNTIELFKQISSNKDIVTSIDDTIGYSNSDFMKKIDSVTDYYWHEGMEIPTEDKVKKFVEMFDNENQSAVESHAIFQRYAKNIIGKDCIDVLYKKYGENFVSLIKYAKSDGSIGYVIKKNKSKIRISDSISGIISEINSYAK